MARQILCQHCGAPIHSREALAVGGRALQPVHTRCYADYAADQPWYRKPGWPVNRWTSFVPFNALLLALVLGLHLFVKPVPEPRWPELALVLLIVNAWLLLARLISYVSLERQLPPHE